MNEMRVQRMLRELHADPVARFCEELVSGLTPVESNVPQMKDPATNLVPAWTASQAPQG
jgi:hypothetical protein